MVQLTEPEKKALQFAVKNAVSVEDIQRMVEHYGQTKSSRSYVYNLVVRLEADGILKRLPKFRKSQQLYKLVKEDGNV